MQKQETLPVQRAAGRDRSQTAATAQQFSHLVRRLAVQPSDTANLVDVLAFDGYATKVIVTSSSTRAIRDAARRLLTEGKNGNSWIVVDWPGAATNGLRGKLGIVARVPLAAIVRERAAEQHAVDCWTIAARLPRINECGREVGQ
jgi:hypothetical protein